jgi:Uma2 family endonuclease
MNTLLQPVAPPDPYVVTLQSGHRYEYVDGQLREKPPRGAEVNRVATILARMLDAFAAENLLGLVFTQECGYQIFTADPTKVRKPDVSFIARGRLPNDRPPRGHVTIAPDLEVEVVSPNDLAEEIDQRVADYLVGGVPLIWVIYPASRSAWVLRKDGSAAGRAEADDLDGEDVLPGFRCPLRSLFADLLPAPKGNP